MVAVRGVLEAGVTPQPTYRSEWIDQTATKLIETLGDAAERLQREHPEDAISLNDLGDVLLTAKARLIKAANVETEDAPSGSGSTLRTH